MLKQKIIIVDYYQCIADPNILIASTANRGQLTLHRCPIPEKRETHGQLYITTKGLFFSLTDLGLRQVFEHFPPSMRIRGRHCHNGKRGCDYPRMYHFGPQCCHVLSCTTFHGPRPVINGVKYQCDHKNGCVTDWCKDNVEWVSPRENHRRRRILKALRSIHINPAHVPYNILDVFLNPEIVSDIPEFTRRIAALHNLLGTLYIFYPDDFKRWLTIPTEEFNDMISHYYRVDTHNVAGDVYEGD